MILAGNMTDIFVIAVAVIISITLHEVAHGLVAKWNGDFTAKAAGRLTLNPLVHFDLFGFLMLMTVGFGYAKPVPVNPFNFKHQKRGIFTVAIAGVTVNMILAFVSTMFMMLINFLMIKFSYNMVLMIFFDFFTFMALINSSLIFFNLLPIYPLDGFRVVEAFTRFINPFNKFMRDYGHLFLIGLIGLGIVVDILLKFGAPNWMQYFDILGLYIRTCSRLLLRAFSWFWGLIIP